MCNEEVKTKCSARKCATYESLRAESVSQTELLNRVIALGRKEVLSPSLWQQSWISLFEKELRRLCSSGWMGWSGLSTIGNRVFSVLLSNTAAMVSSAPLITEPAFLISWFRLLVLLLRCCLPSKPHQRTEHWQEQTARKYAASCCTQRRISASSGIRVCSSSSCVLPWCWSCSSVCCR